MLPLDEGSRPRVPKVGTHDVLARNSADTRVVVPSDLHSAELLGESDEKPFRPADVAEPIRVLILNHFAHELRAARAEPLERLIEIVYCEHGAQVAQSVHWSIPVICHRRRRKKARELEAAVAVRRAHHGNLYALVAQSSDTSRPFSFDHGSPFELEAELEKEIDRRCEVVDDNAYVVHPFKRHGMHSTRSLTILANDHRRMGGRHSGPQ